MRKRIVIGVVAIIGVGVLVFVVSQPRKGSLEYHKREYFDAQPGGGWRDVLRQLLGREPMSREVSKEDQARMKFHEKALIKLGYLEEWTFIVSNQPPTNVLNALAGAVGATGPSMCGSILREQTRFAL